ncbi:hypothetical protein LSH36_273g02001 [Paralvinella palmiformis]|uniref:Knr4/Smi1-like domain-containing protein n=1 Tax=Paralvinella palmiformis TaxID=53620 RepID=A0AAD9JLH5_9ANNE|nr:hypothetical protein LSH36_273g02001 [Paralvinella palmiformis]
MMATEDNLYEKLTFSIIQSLEKRHGVCNINMSTKPPTDRPSIVSWEQKFSCIMPEDLRNFYLTSNGFLLTWCSKLHENRIPVGHIEINPLERLIRIGSLGATDAGTNLPGLVDVELVDHEDEDKQGTEISLPRFDHRSRIFELDPCEGYGKVCFVYRNTKPGIAAQKAEIWFLDRALRWHFLADNFANYYRLMLVHLGLPQWQYIFTDIGISPQAKQQWYNLYCPLRLGLDIDVFAKSCDVKKSTITQIDVTKVFKGKSDKKKLGTVQNVKRKQIPSAKGAAPGPGGRNTGPSIQTVKNYR